jgi:hypothetical protein
MAITGNAKVFYKNYMYGLAASNVVVSTGASDNLVVKNKYRRWFSVGSNDTITETIVVTFPAAKTIDRIALLIMNWKEFNAQYWNGSAYADFAGVISDSSSTPAASLSETTNALDCKYYEVTSVSTTEVKFSITKTITTDSQKYVGNIYIGREIGTFTDDITSEPNKVDAFLIQGEVYKTPTGLGQYQILKNAYGKFRAKIKIKRMNESADITIINTMFAEREVGFLLNGGVSGYAAKGWDMCDFSNCLVKGDIDGNHAIGRDTSMGYNYSVELLET